MLYSIFPSAHSFTSSHFNLTHSPPSLPDFLPFSAFLSTSLSRIKPRFLTDIISDIVRCNEGSPQTVTSRMAHASLEITSFHSCFHNTIPSSCYLQYAVAPWERPCEGSRGDCPKNWSGRNGMPRIDWECEILVVECHVAVIACFSSQLLIGIHTVIFLPLFLCLTASQGEWSPPLERD